jgi:hypothetical protein
MLESCISAATIAENSFSLSLLLTHGAILSTASDHSLNADCNSLVWFKLTTKSHHQNIPQITEDIPHIVNLSLRVGNGLSEPPAIAARVCISFCATSSIHSDNHHFTIFLMRLESGLDNMRLTSFSPVLAAVLVHGIIDWIKSAHNSIIVFTHATHVAINLI